MREGRRRERERKKREGERERERDKMIQLLLYIMYFVGDIKEGDK